MPAAGGRFGLEDRRPPLGRRRNVCSDRVRGDRLHQPIRAFAIGLVDDEDVGDLHDAGLHRLHIVAGAGHEHDDRHVRGRDDVHFVLADADGLDDDDVLAGGVEDERGVAGRAGEPAEMPARRHAADEDAGSDGVRPMRTRSPRIGAAGERTGRIHGNHADRDGHRAADLAVRRSTSVLFPAPGGPVTPMTYARPVRGYDLAGRQRRTASRPR